MGQIIFPNAYFEALTSNAVVFWNGAFGGQLDLEVVI